MSLLDRPHLWILKNRVPIPVADALTWGRWLEKARETGELIVAQTDLDPELKVSTVFLGIDYSFSLSPEAPPILFETMVFGEEKTGRYTRPNGTERTYQYREPLEQWRYSTWAEAQAGHEDFVTRMQAKLDAAHGDVTALLSTIREKPP